MKIEAGSLGQYAERAFYPVLALASALTFGLGASLLAPRLLDAPQISSYLAIALGPPLVYLLLPLGLLAAFVLLRWPLLTLCGLAFALPYNFIGSDLGSASWATPAKATVDLLFFIALGYVFIAPPHWRKWLSGSGLGIALVLFSGWLMFASVVGVLTVEKRSDVLREANWLWFYAIAIPVGMLVRTRKQLWLVLASLGLAALLTQILGFYEFVNGVRYARLNDWLAGATFIRAPFSSPAMFAFYLSLAGLLYAWPQSGVRRRFKAGLALCVLLFGAGLLASLGRSLWLSAFVGLCILLLLARGRTTTFVPLIALVAGALVLVLVLDSFSTASSGDWLGNAWQFLTALGSGDSVSVLSREIEWNNALTVWLRSPLIGAGVGAAYAPSPYNEPSLAAFYVHNSFLNILAKLGLVGFTFFTLMIGATIYTLLCMIQRRRTPAWIRVVSIAVLATVAQLLAFSAFAPAITTTDSVMFFGLLIGLAAAMQQMTTSAQARQDANP